MNIAGTVTENPSVFFTIMGIITIVYVASGAFLAVSISKFIQYGFGRPRARHARSTRRTSKS